jgi:hypothetical protein
MMSRIDSWHWKISTGGHFQNGCHNTAKIQHCPISSKFDMWVDNDVQNWFNLDDIGQCWIFTTHFLCRVLVAILKMADILKILKTQNCSSNGDVDNDVLNWFLTLKNFYRWPFSKWLSQYRKNSTLFNFKGSF